MESYQEASLLIAVVSPAFLKSQVLLNGLRNYENVVKGQGGFFEDGLSKIFKVVKSPVEMDELLPELKNIIHYEFYHTDPHTGDVLEFNRFFGRDAERDFWLKLMDIAYDIYQFLIKTNPESGRLAMPVRVSRKSIFLAGTGRDLVFHRDVIKRELQRHGYRVLPEQSLPSDSAELEKKVEDDLEASDLAIHLIGEDYGELATNTDRSEVDIQNRISTQYSAEMLKNNPDRDFRRLIWITPELDQVSERQKIFIEDIRSDAELLENSEIFQIPLQDFRGFLRYELILASEEKQDMATKHAEGLDLSTSIYLICDKEDVDECKPLANFLSDQGYKVVASKFEGDILDLRELHHERLRQCDGSLIYIGNGKEEWTRTKLQDILKAPGFGKHKPMKAKAIYMGSAQEINERLKPDTLVLGEPGKMDPDKLKPFLTKLEN